LRRKRRGSQTASQVENIASTATPLASVPDVNQIATGGEGRITARTAPRVEPAIGRFDVPAFVGNHLTILLHKRLMAKAPGKPAVGGNPSGCSRYRSKFTEIRDRYRSENRPWWFEAGPEVRAIPTEGREATFVGCVGAELDVEAGRKAAHLAALNVLAVVRQHLGSLDRVMRIVRLSLSVVAWGDIC
jgi:hypothetical protein